MSFMISQSSEQSFQHKAKADLYRLLSICYYEPEQSFLEEDVFGQLRKSLTVLDPERASIAEVLETCFREAGDEALLLDYSRLFLGPFEIPAKPYGSIYLDGDNVVMGESTLRAVELYNQGGFQVADNFRELPDHVAVSLEFIYLLNFRLGDSTETEQQEQLTTLLRTFLKEHLGLWISPFTKSMENSAKTTFYCKLAQLTREIVMDDLRRWSIALSRP